MMKAETARGLVVDHTKQEMVRQGVSHLTMDAIAQGLGMSKRTLYQLFPSKVCLVHICLADLAKEKKRLLLAREDEGQSCVKTLFDVVGGYVDLMHSMGSVLLADLAQDTEYQAFSRREESFWLQLFIDVLNRCKAYGYLLPEVDPDHFAKDLLLLLYENSLNGSHHTTKWMFCQALLRGIFRAEAISLIDECEASVMRSKPARCRQ